MLSTSLFLVALMLMGSVAPASSLVTGKTFVIYTGSGAFHQDYNGFYGNYTGAGNTVINASDFTYDALVAILENTTVDALFLPGNEFADNESLTPIKTWFESGKKLLWVAGDSDFGGYFVSQKLNPVLETVGSVLRLDAGAVDDPVSNDNASYRVVANQLGDGPIASTIDATDFKMIFHGSTSVYYVENGTPKDLRNATVDNVEVVVKSSKDAKVIDQDLSASSGDFYVTINETTGNYPMLVTETIGDSMVVVSGEANFADYKNMYGNTFEVSREFHYGSIVVDAIITYFFEKIGTADSSFLPFNFVVPFSIFMATAIFIRKRRN